jgi:hypothetical protein
MISRFFDIAPKPGLRPESAVSPITHTRQKIFSKKGVGGSKRSGSRDAEEVEETLRFAKSAIISPNLESGATFFLRQEIVRELSDKGQFSPCHLSQDWTPESPDSPRITTRQWMF